MYITEMDPLPSQIGKTPIEWKDLSKQRDRATTKLEMPQISDKEFIIPDRKNIEFFWINPKKTLFLLSCQVPDVTRYEAKGSVSSLSEDRCYAIQTGTFRWNFFGGVNQGEKFMYRLEDGNWAVKAITQQEKGKFLEELIPPGIRKIEELCNQEFLQRGTLFAVKTLVTWEEIRKIASLMGMDSRKLGWNRAWGNIFEEKFEFVGEETSLDSNKGYLLKGMIKRYRRLYWDLTDSIYYVVRMLHLYEDNKNDDT